MPTAESDRLLTASLGYVRAKFAFKDVIRIAGKSGISDSDIAPIGYNLLIPENVA
jgi:hypothetical protein